jgi:hypothetical protein
VLIARRNVIALGGRAVRAWIFSRSGSWYVRSAALGTHANAGSALSQIERYRVR